MVELQRNFHVFRSGNIGTELTPKTGEETIHTMNRKPMPNVPTDEQLLPGDFPRVFADEDLKALQDAADAAELLLPAAYNCRPSAPRPQGGNDTEALLPLGVG
jgi:hypothetical protein